MIFFINNDGTISKNIPESVYQGSSNANNIYVVAPFASNLSATVSFRLPNGVITVPYALSYTGEVSSFTDHAGNTYRGWSFALPNDITQHFGTVIAQFAFRGVGNKLLATSATSFTVNRGVPSALPEAPSETVYDQILENLSAIQSDLGNGYYTARAVYPFNSSYTYQANELVYYPEGEYGIYLQSLRANNTQAPYTNGILGSRWKVVLDFNAISVRFSEMESKFDDMQNSFDGVVDNAKSEADRAKKSADEANIAQGAAQKSADSASASASDALQAKNTTEAVKSDTETIKKVAENARDVAQKFAESVPAFEYNGLTYYSARYYAELSRGYFENRNKAFAFDTTEQVLAWYNGNYTRADGLTKDDLVIGDLIFVKTVDVPDAWYSGETETNADMWWVGYPFSQWEGDKVALLEYTERAESAAERSETIKDEVIAMRDKMEQDIAKIQLIGYSKKYARYYVSLGDSIAAGHTINSEWETNYGEDSQYGKNGNTSTEIVISSYTDLIRKDLETSYETGDVSTLSFARSGDTVADLLEKLDDKAVITAIERAHIVTVCIGANEILGPAMSHLEDYINNGSPALDELAAEIDYNLAILNDDSNSNSYKSLFNRLAALNPNAKYVFTTIYNPLKYLWIDESTVEEDYKDGFFGPLMWALPDIEVGDFDLGNSARSAIYNTDIVQTLFDRINGPSRNGTDGLAAWTEVQITKLNQILKNKIEAYNNPNFAVVDTKLLYESFPDRPISANKHYNDLISMEFTRGYIIDDVDWGKFWNNIDVHDVLADPESVMSNIISTVITEVIVPDIDPHPESYGHYVLYHSFAEAVSGTSLKRYHITYNANGQTGSMLPQEIVGISGMTAYASLANNAFTPSTGYNFIGWNTKADGSGAAYTNGQVVGIMSDITLYAQWSNLCTVTYKHSNKTNLYGDDETGHKECYELYINGELKPKFGTFAEGSSTQYSVPYGSTIRVVVSNYNPTELTYDDVDCDVYLNGVNVATGYRGTEYTFTLTSDVEVDFQWKIAGSIATLDAQSWEDCYITTK